MDFFSQSVAAFFITKRKFEKEDQTKDQKAYDCPEGSLSDLFFV